MINHHIPCIKQRLINKFKNLTSDHLYIIEAVQFLKPLVQNNNQSIYLSFNGGKDATIVLILTYLAIVSNHNNIHENCLVHQDIKIKLPRTIYFQQPNPFPEMMDFYQSIKTLFQLQTIPIPTKKYTEQLTNFSKNYPLTHIIMGSRNDDPYCGHLGLINDSDVDKGYPLFKRVNPIIRWDYQKVWEAIKVLDIPYCKLYEQGYTSIGNMDNTIKNPTFNQHDKNQYFAFKVNPNSERICRVTDMKN